MAMELKQILIEKILANFSQPREKFDKEKIQELTESILSNGLINPISVREYKGGRFMIVAGERRWMAHKLAKIKTIPAFVKEYKDDGEWMVESLIENIHRENLQDSERGKYLFKLKQQIEKSEKKEISNTELGKKIGVDSRRIGEWLWAFETRKKSPFSGKISDSRLMPTREIKDEKLKSEVMKKISREDIPTQKVKEIVSIIKRATPEVKKALLSDDITTEQAERITKLKEPEQRAKAIQEHKSIKIVERNVERNVEKKVSDAEKREFAKKLVQINEWLNSVRSGVTECNTAIENVLRVILISTKFLSIMDDKQKEKLDEQIERLLEKLERGEQIVKQIQDKL